ncbi:MAG: 50S ribosomal protein L25, partial [Thiothrix sp.]
NLPEYIEVDMSNIEKGQIMHLSDITLPEGVSIPALALGEDHNTAIAACH